MSFSTATRLVGATATGTIDSGIGRLYSLAITAGADAATAVLKTGGASGTIIAKVGAGIGLSDQKVLLGGPGYSNLHLTVTGTTPQVDVEIG